MARRPVYDHALAARGRNTGGDGWLPVEELGPFIVTLRDGAIPKSPRIGIPPRPLLNLVVEDLEAYYTETRTHRDSIDDLELMGEWFWEKTKAGRLLLLLEAVSIASENKVMLQIVEMSLMAPRFWSEGPLPGTSAAGW